MCAVCELSWMKNLKGKDAVLKLFSKSTVFAFPRFDCGIRRWIGRPDCSSISFSSSTESELHKDPASLINLLLLFNGKPFVVGFTWGSLWSVMDLCMKVLRGVKTLQTCKKPANGFEKLLLHGLASHSEKFSGKLCCCCYIISSTYGRIKLKLKLL